MVFASTLAGITLLSFTFRSVIGGILSDISMPGMNGYEFVRKIKEIDKQVKIILMSAFEINVNEFHNLLPDIKIDAFLQKPFHIQQLNEVIETISRD